MFVEDAMETDDVMRSTNTQRELSGRSQWITRVLWMAVGLALFAALYPFESTVHASQGDDVIQPPAQAVPILEKKFSVAAKVRAQAAYGRLPLRFEANRGQTDSQVRFLSRSRGYDVFFTPNEAVFSFSGGEGKPRPVATNAHMRAVLRMRLVGAKPNPDIQGFERLLGHSNYLIGGDPKKWRTNIPAYAKVKYQEVYPGIDLVYYGNQRRLEHDFIVAPGADPKAVRIAFEGAEKLTVDGQGDLVVQTAAGEVRFQDPYIYQIVDGLKQSISGGYVILEHSTPDPRPLTPEVGFRLAAYDIGKPLVIDPVLLYSTTFGGSGDDSGTSIAVDALGNAYVTGVTESNDFPPEAVVTTDAGSPDTDTDVLVAKLDPTGATLEYVTYIGGSQSDGSFAGNFFLPKIAVDNAGNAYVAGATKSTADFPGPAGSAEIIGGPGGGDDVFVVKLNPAGTALLQSALLGGSLVERLPSIAVDALGNAYVMGQTNSTDLLPTPNAYDTTCGNSTCNRDAFVAKLEFDSSSPTPDLTYFTYLGGDSQASQFVQSIAAGPNGEIYVAGRTSSDPFPVTTGAFDTTYNGGGTDIFFATLDPNVDLAGCLAEPDPVTGVQCEPSLLYSTYLGGSDDEAPAAAVYMAVDAAGNAFITSDTTSSDFPEKNPIPGSDCPGSFVTVIDPTPGADLVYSTCDAGNGSNMAVNSPGNIIFLNDGTLDIVDPVNPELVAYPAGFGGKDIALDASCNVYATGTTAADDVFVEKIGENRFFAYISNFNNGTVSVVDTQDNIVIDTVPVGVNPAGGFPEGVAVHPNGTRAYVTTLVGDEVVVIDTTTNTVLETIALPTNLAPVGVAVHPNGKWVYVANSGVQFTSTTHTISVIDTATNELLDLDPSTAGVTDQIELAITAEANVPFGIAAHPDGSRLYVTNLQGDFVTVIGVTEDPVTSLPVHTVDAVVDVGDAPQGIAVGPAGLVYVANSGTGIEVPPATGTVSVIDASNTIVVFDDGNGGTTDKIEVGGEPFGVAVHPNGTTVYVTDGEFNSTTLSVLKFTAALPALPSVSPVTVGKGGRGVSVTPDGSFVYVVNLQDDSVSVIDTSNNTRLDFDPNVSGDQDLALATGAAPVALGQFIAIPVLDEDFDGIQDLIDGTFAGGVFVPESNNDSNDRFTNQHLCGNSFGTIDNVPLGMSVGVSSPAGIVIEGFGGDGSQQVTVTACDFELLYDQGDVTVIEDCGSLTTKVVSGPVEILLDNSGVVTVPSGVAVRVAEIAAQQFEITNLGNTVPIVVDVNGELTTIVPGATEVVSLVPTLACPECDLNNDGVVNFGDLSLLFPCMGQPASNPVCAFADVNGDGIVNFNDVSQIVGNFS